MEVAPGQDPSRDAVLQEMENDLLTLLNMTATVLVRVKRPPPVSGSVSRLKRKDPVASALPAHSPFGAVTTGQTLARRIEQRSRGLLLETSLTAIQQSRIDRTLQSALDLLCALQAARYAWQIALLLPLEGPSGRDALPHLKRVTEQAIEMNSRVAFAIEGKEGAGAAVADQYRAYWAVKEETAVHFHELRESGTLSQTARRLVRAALWSVTVAAESMAKAAARFTLPLGAARAATKEQQEFRHLDRGDDLLAPLPRR
ncbi:MAG: hypothetical protein H7Z41_06545 [Cytophagales bacterium]|nr:hypothetical protein [Armatimonadota bacterium]